jgi:hypothetical protein
MASSLAKRIRECTENETFDLSSFNSQEKVHELVTLSFSEPFDASVRITFVIGGGKLVRGKFEERLGKILSEELRALNFQEDKSAACGFSSNAFKIQHDIDANLIYLHVFPAFKPKGSSEVSDSSSSVSSGLDENFVLLLTSDLSQFKSVITVKCISYSQKKKLSSSLNGFQEHVRGLEEKMMKNVNLSASEQALYEISCVDIDSKLEFLSTEMKRQVADGKLTSGERDEILQQMDSKIESLKGELEKVKVEGKEALVDKVSSSLVQLVGKRTNLAKVTNWFQPLKNEAELKKCYLELKQIQALENKLKKENRMASLAELKEIGRKEELEDEREVLMNAAKGWYEDEQAFRARMNDAETRFKVASGGKRK